MAFILADRVKETSVTQGYGSITLNGPFGGFQSFNAAIGDGNQTYYTIENNIRWEIGIGTYSSSTNSLSRDLILRSSDNGNAINLDGVSIVFCTYPADKSVVINTQDYVDVRGHSGILLDRSSFLATGTLLHDVRVSGQSVFNPDANSKISLTLIRSTSGNFIHAYRDDAFDRTIGLYIDGQTIPTWRLGLKNNPNNVYDPPSYGYVYGKDGVAGLVANSTNSLELNNSNGLSYIHNNTQVIRLSSTTGVYLNSLSSTYPAFSVNGGPSMVANIQEWKSYAGTILSIIDKNGYLGINRTSADYQVDVTGSGRFDAIIVGSGRMTTLTLNSGIYFPDGSFQNSALAVNNSDIAYISGVAVYASGQSVINANDIIAVSGLITSGSGTVERFDTDLVVSLSNGKTFGKYLSGETIPASGKTPGEVITLAIVEPIAPTVSLTSASTVAFNQTSVSNTLNFDYTINSLGASVASVVLEWRRGNSGSWTTLSTSTTTPSSYVHSFTDTNYNTSVINYRYTVTDSVGGTNTATKDITPSAYSAPTVSFSVTANSTTSPETNSNRERGNVNSNISGTVTRNSAYVDLVSYTLQYSVDNGAWVDIGSAQPIGPGTSSITLTNHNPVANNTASNIRYRVKVIDAYQQSLASQVYSGTSTVNFGFMIFYGPSASVPLNSAAVRSLPSRLFTVGNNTFNLNTGSTEINYTVAIPNTESISEVLDLDALNANITSQYINNPFNVDDAGGTAVSYKVYTMTNAIPYSSNHRHQVTKG